ncbi:hypothetical protein [uncultured Kordia sp.]|uniref:hypothetical protein n=1 Tax=uncultured Kordia sp. TaxID=507699 RepID=UPI002617798C|nr:hypothetical protein [uncultured Kordia sp.]
MKKSLKKYLALFTIMLVTVLACQKEDQAPQDTTATATEIIQKAERLDSERIAAVLNEYKGRRTEGNFIGRIINENDAPIMGATVSLGGQQQTTDENGIVVFLGAAVHQNFAYAQASANGYTDGSRVMVPTGENSFTIKLFRINNSQRIDSSGGEIAIPTDSDRELMIYFNDGFVDENGSPYSGDVYVTANYLDPLSEDTANTMPGELYGIDADYQEVALGSYGMVSVELRGSAGEKLQITNPARIEMPIHPSQVATAPNEMNMWSYDNQYGVWLEETIAQRAGDYYIAEVDHFSFWNCDAPFPVVNFDATVIDSGTSNPLSGMKVTITYGSFSRFAITNSSGMVSGKIPSGQTLTITITDQCGTVLSTGTYGPYSATTSLTLPVTLATAPINVVGSLLDCSSSPVTNGYVVYKNTSGQVLGTFIVTAGIHNYTGVACSIPITIDVDGVDNTNGQAATTVTVVANPTAVANLVACGGSPTEYIRYSVNAGPIQYEIINPGGGVQPPSFINVQASSPTGQTYIYGNTITPGIYPFDHSLSTTALAMEVFGDINGINPAATTGLTNNIQFTVVNVGPVGSYIDINFVGDYVDRFGTVRNVNGSAHIIRDY